MAHSSPGKSQFDPSAHLLLRAYEGERYRYVDAEGDATRSNNDDLSPLADNVPGMLPGSGEAFAAKCVRPCGTLDPWSRDWAITQYVGNEEEIRSVKVIDGNWPFHVLHQWGSLCNLPVEAFS